MFQFSHLPPAEDFQQVPGYNAGWVAPFGDLRLRLPATCRSLSQLGYVLLRLLMPRHPPSALTCFSTPIESLSLLLPLLASACAFSQSLMLFSLPVAPPSIRKRIYRAKK